ncbi:hypothetical protein Hanom_Chr12g01120911 [Helianthus anomalus]
MLFLIIIQLFAYNNLGVTGTRYLKFKLYVRNNECVAFDYKNNVILIIILYA